MQYSFTVTWGQVSKQVNSDYEPYPSNQEARSQKTPNEYPSSKIWARLARNLQSILGFTSSLPINQLVDFSKKKSNAKKCRSKWSEGKNKKHGYNVDIKNLYPLKIWTIYLKYSRDMDC